LKRALDEGFVGVFNTHGAMIPLQP
jgi:hypothetical protein